MAPKGAEYVEIAHKRQIEKKTHVSFPQLKYPSLRDATIKDAVTWLTGKAMDDGAEGLWRVHDGIYDLTSFVQKHPGGADWLELTQGTDITEAYECHHLNPAVDKILQNYYVRNAKTPRNSPFTFKDDGFFRSLKRVVIEELKKVPKGTAKKSDHIIDGLFITYLLTSAFSCYTKIPWLVNVSYLIASLAMAWTMVASHNYIHRRSNWRMHLFSLGGWSYRDFRVSHALSHHLYPNTLMDLEISSFEPLVLWNPRLGKPAYAKLSILIEFLYFPFGFAVNFFTRLLSAFFREGYYTKHFRFTDLIGLVVPFWMSFASGCSLWDAFYMWLWIVCTSSFIFLNIGSNAAHHHPEVWKDGDEYGVETQDWGVHEVETLMDRKDVNNDHFRIMTFFGNHTMHHLFPTIDHAVLTHLYPFMLDYCEKYNANYRLTDQFNMAIGQYKSSTKNYFSLKDH